MPTSITEKFSAWIASRRTRHTPRGSAPRALQLGTGLYEACLHHYKRVELDKTCFGQARDFRRPRCWSKSRANEPSSQRVARADAWCRDTKFLQTAVSKESRSHEARLRLKRVEQLFGSIVRRPSSDFGNRKHMSGSASRNSGRQVESHVPETLRAWQRRGDRWRVATDRLLT